MAQLRSPRTYKISIVAILGVVLLATCLGPGAFAAAPDDIWKRFELRDALPPKRGLVSELPGGGAKVWTQDDKAAFRHYLDLIYDKVPGLVERAVQYRPVRVYRAKDPAFLQLRAITETQELVLADWWFSAYDGKTEQQKDILKMQPLIHEMFHLAEPFLSVSYGDEWRSLVEPRIENVRNRVKQMGMSIYEARATSTRPDEHDAIAHAEGLPYLWAAYATYEALAEYGATMVNQKHIAIDPQVQAILQKHFIDRPQGADPAKAIAHNALSAWEKGDWETAAAQFDEAEKKGANWALFYAYKGKFWFENAFKSKNGAANAYDAYSKAVRMMAFDAPKDHMRMHALLAGAAGDRKAAIADYSAILKVHLYDLGTVKNRLSDHMKLNDMQGALEDYDLLIENESDSPEALEYFTNRSRVRYSLLQHPGAIEDLGEALKRAPAAQKPTLYFMRAENWVQLKKPSKAFADYAEAIKLNPKFIEAYARRGFVLTMYGQFDEAEKDFTAARKINAKDLTVSVALSLLARERNDDKRADEMMQAATAINAKAAKEVEAFFQTALKAGRLVQSDASK